MFKVAFNYSRYLEKCICSKLWKRLKGFPLCLTSCRDCWSCNFCAVNVHFLWLFMKQELQFQFSDSWLRCILQQFPRLAARLPVCTFFSHYLGKMTEGNTQVSAFVSWCLLTETDLHSRVYCKAYGGCWLLRLACPPHILLSSFFLEIGISFCDWDKLTGNGTRLYWHHLCIARALEPAE